MNIFYLDSSPFVCAKYHCDKHVVKMILESAQILCTVINEKAGKQVTPYKSTHVNHPCIKWAGESFANWNYVRCLMLELGNEWKYRYNHTQQHLTIDKIYYSDINFRAFEYLYIDVPFTPPPLCMPDYCKVPDDAVASYRNYYNNEKKHLHKWTNREVPFFITQE